MFSEASSPSPADADHAVEAAVLEGELQGGVGGLGGVPLAPELAAEPPADRPPSGSTSGRNPGTDRPTDADQFARGEQLDGEEAETLLVPLLLPPLDVLRGLLQVTYRAVVDPAHDLGSA